MNHWEGDVEARVRPIEAHRGKARATIRAHRILDTTPMMTACELAMTDHLNREIFRLVHSRTFEDELSDLAMKLRLINRVASSRRCRCPDYTRRSIIRDECEFARSWLCS